MSRNRRDAAGPGRERTAEQRERDRLEREARRAREQRTGAAPGSDAPAATPEPRDPETPTPPRVPRERSTPGGDAARGRTAPRGGPGAPPAAPRGGPRAGARADDGAPRGGGGRAAAGDGAPVEPPFRDRAADRRAARRGVAPGDRDEPAVLRIQPDPPAPPAAAAGVLGDESERPIGIRRVRRAGAPRTPRAIVTPPGDVPGGPARARRSVKSRVIVLAALAIFAVLIIGALLLLQPFGSVEGARVRVVIPPGASAGEIGQELASAGVVASGRLFSIRATLAGKRGDLRSGRHLLRHGMTYGAALDALTKAPRVSKTATIDVTIPEGRSRREIARLVAGKGLRGRYLDASARFRGRLNPFRYGAPRGTRSLEGFLFPATYELRAGAPANDLVAKQFAAFAANLKRVDLRRARRKNLTAYDVLIIASMVEREAQVAAERPKIAAVIYNRLKDATPLGIDATIRYATDNWTKPLRQSELQIESPYNTRKRQGLPPTPIGNPGLASIRAAAAPAKVDYRYYVVRPGSCGKHAFSSSFAQFQADSRRYDAARAAVGGKSPTTC
jgi:peptidoglycan lytic transglycosylase G